MPPGLRSDQSRCDSLKVYRPQSLACAGQCDFGCRYTKAGDKTASGQVAIFGLHSRHHDVRDALR